MWIRVARAPHVCVSRARERARRDACVAAMADDASSSLAPSAAMQHPASVLGKLATANQQQLLALASRTDELRAHYVASRVPGVRHADHYVLPPLNHSLPPAVRCGGRSNATPSAPSIFTPEIVSKCTTTCCRGFHHALAASTVATYEREESQRQARCGLTATTTKHAALLLRGRIPSNRTLREVFLGYMQTIVCPLRRLSFRVDSFVATYAPLTADAAEILQPSLMAVLSTRNSSNLMSTLACIVHFVRHSWKTNVVYDFVVLTRMDITLKQPLTQLESLSVARGGFQRFHYPFKSARSNWREWGSASVCRQWESTRRVADNLHTFGGPSLACVLRAFEHYLVHEMEALHYLTYSFRHFLRGHETGHLVSGCYDSDPSKGQRNPLFEILPRNRKYNNSICRGLSDFTYEPTHGQYCCQSERYCCPTELLRCPPRSRHFPYFAGLDPNGSEFRNLTRRQPPLPGNTHSRAAILGHISPSPFYD